MSRRQLGHDLDRASERLRALLDEPRWAQFDEPEDEGGPGGELGLDEEPQFRRLTPEYRSAARRRGRPARSWDPEAALDLHLHEPPGYRRDRRGRWRYTRSGRPVPGARDLTLSDLYNFALDADIVLVPTSLAGADELMWCRRVAVGERAIFLDGLPLVVLEVPGEEWEARQYAPIGLVAPELIPQRLLGLAEVAKMAGISYQTAAAYLCRREQVPAEHRFPEPVARFAGTPVWSAPVVGEWLQRRPGRAGRPSAKI